MMEVEEKELEQLLEYLNWALSIIDDDFKKTGKIGFAEAIVWKSAKRHVERLKAKLT